MLSIKFSSWVGGSGGRRGRKDATTASAWCVYNGLVRQIIYVQEFESGVRCLILHRDLLRQTSQSTFPRAGPPKGRSPRWSVSRCHYLEMCVQSEKEKESTSSLNRQSENEKNLSDQL